MVNEHAEMGYSDYKIREHLVQCHGIDSHAAIPLPSAKSQRLRRSMERCAPQMGQVGPDGLIVLQGAAAQDSEIAGLPDDDGMDPDEEANLAEELLEDMYVSAGPTMLDRLIHGNAAFVGLHLIPALTKGSDYETTLAFVEDKIAEKQLISTKPYEEIEHICEALDMAMLPWIKPKGPTKNIQIDVSLAESFAKGVLPKNQGWVAELCQQPFYVDIDGALAGERHISAIFCEPNAAKDGFKWSAVVEWGKRGYEAVVVGLFGKSDLALALFNDAGMSEQQRLDASEALYAEIAQDAEKIVAMSWMYRKSLLAKGTALQALPKVAVQNKGPVKKKKAIGRAKTHSYFVVQKIENPKEIVKVGASKKWSLDHVVGVSGHLRWQPCGKGLMQVKLIWIDAYEKGSGAQVRPFPPPVLVA